MNKAGNMVFENKITVTILLTLIPAILCLPLFFEAGLGWILGAFASAVNFRWLAVNVRNNFSQNPVKSKLSAVKGTYLRMLFLLVYSILILSFIKPNVISFGLGLLAGQIIIFLHVLTNNMKKNKYFRGKDG